MSRSHGKLKAEVWLDDDWRDLSFGAQWAYSMLLSQGKLSLAGALDMMPKRWVAYADNLDLDQLDAMLDELEARGKIVIDEKTDELVIRSFVRHDIPAASFNMNLMKGFWSAWGAIASTKLQRVVIANLPDHVWEKSGSHVPEEASAMRFEPQNDPGSNRPFEPVVSTDGWDDPSEPPKPLPEPLPKPEAGAAANADSPEPDDRTAQPTLRDLLGLAMGKRAMKCTDDIGPLADVWEAEYGDAHVRAFLLERISEPPPQWPRQFEPMLRARPLAAPVKPRDCAEMGNSQEAQDDCGSGFGPDTLGCRHCERGAVIAKQRAPIFEEAS